MNGIDIGLFDFDRHNSLYFFVLNADEDIYLRYGGRDSKAADTYLNLRSLELALRQGLEIHEQYLDGQREPSDRPDPLFPNDIPLLLEHTKRGRCVECHLIADYQTQHKEQDGTLDKLNDMFRSPDIKSLGVTLDVPRGLVVQRTRGAAHDAGVLPGDQLTRIEGQTVWTFGDFQYQLAQVERDQQSIQLEVQRNGEPFQIELRLPPRWWLTDLDYRFWSIDPQVFYKSRALTAAEKAGLSLDPTGFASKVTVIDPQVELLKKHELKVGDIVYAVNGVQRDDIAHTCVLYIKLRCTAGEPVQLSVLRDGKRLEMPLRTGRQGFRK